MSNDKCFSSSEEPKQRYDQHQNRRDATNEMQMNLAGQKEMVCNEPMQGK